MNLHHQYYDLRERTWQKLEETVRAGCQILGDFSIVIGSITAPPQGLRRISTRFVDYTEIIISGIVADPEYAIFPPKNSEKDLHVHTNTIKVILHGSKEILEVEPNLADLETLCTYLSGGYDLMEG
ncbi:MAG: hypothetical protein H6581_12785 [Bacteroidia bacterium]|nr:hypothetical protein [Bacteroidia bacterium]